MTYFKVMDFYTDEETGETLDLYGKVNFTKSHLSDEEIIAIVCECYDFDPEAVCVITEEEYTENTEEE